MLEKTYLGISPVAKAELKAPFLILKASRQGNEVCDWMKNT